MVIIIGSRSRIRTGIKMLPIHNTLRSEIDFLIYNPVSGDQVCACDEEGGGAPHPLHGGGEGGALCRPRGDHGRLGKLRIRIRNSQLGRSGSGVIISHPNLIIPFMEGQREALCRARGDHGLTR